MKYSDKDYLHALQKKKDGVVTIFAISYYSSVLDKRRNVTYKNAQKTSNYYSPRQNFVPL